MTCEIHQLAEMTTEELLQALKFHLDQVSIIQSPAVTRVEQRSWGKVTITEVDTDVNMGNVMRIQYLREELGKRNPPLSP